MKNSPFLAGYLAAILFAECDMSREDENNDTSLESEGYGIDCFSAEAISRARRECASFMRDARKLLHVAYADDSGYDAERAGADFYFSGAGHGVGFWDRGLSVGDALHKIADGAWTFCVYSNADETLSLD